MRKAAFEAVAGQSLLGNKEKLHQMEVGETAVLATGTAGRKASIGSVDSSGSVLGGVPVNDDEKA
jgi:hypothetical protein